MDCSLYWNDISIGEKYVIENKRKINGKRERREIQILKKKTKKNHLKKPMNIGPEPYTLQKRMGVVRESYQKECSGKGKNIYVELIKQPERNRSNGKKERFFFRKKNLYRYIRM